MSADVRRIGASCDSRFWAAQTRLRKSVYAVLRCLHNFCVVCVVLTRTMREICMEYQWLSAKIFPLSRSSTTFHWRLADIRRLFRTCNTYVSLQSRQKLIGALFGAFVCLGFEVHGLLVLCAIVQFIGDFSSRKSAKMVKLSTDKYAQPNFMRDSCVKV